MRKYILYTLVLAMIVTIGFSATVKAGWLFGPSNYDECILEYMKNSQSNVAVAKIKKACRDKFYKPKPSVPKKKKKAEEPIDKYDFDAVDRELEQKGRWSKKMCDCILNNMKDVDNKRAAFLIYKSCAEKTGEWLSP